MVSVLMMTFLYKVQKLNHMYKLTIDNALVLSCKTFHSKYANALNDANKFVQRKSKWWEKVINSG